MASDIKKVESATRIENNRIIKEDERHARNIRIVANKTLSDNKKAEIATRIENNRKIKEDDRQARNIRIAANKTLSDIRKADSAAKKADSIAKKAESAAKKAESVAMKKAKRDSIIATKPFARSNKKNKVLYPNLVVKMEDDEGMVVPAIVIG